MFNLKSCVKLIQYLKDKEKLVVWYLVILWYSANRFIYHSAHSATTLKVKQLNSKPLNDRTGRCVLEQPWCFAAMWAHISGQMSFRWQADAAQTDPASTKLSVLTLRWLSLVISAGSPLSLYRPSATLRVKCQRALSKTQAGRRWGEFTRL